MRQAIIADCESLVEMMAEFYAEADYPLNRKRARAAFTECERLGVRALHLEVGRDNPAAQSLYRRAGFVDNDRQLLTLRLADPTHMPE